MLVLLALFKHVYFLIDITVRNLGQQSVKLPHRALKLIGSCIECAANFLLLRLRSSYCVQFDAHRDRKFLGRLHGHEGLPIHERSRFESFGWNRFFRHRSLKRV